MYDLVVLVVEVRWGVCVRSGGISCGGKVGGFKELAVFDVVERGGVTTGLVVLVGEARWGAGYDLVVFVGVARWGGAFFVDFFFA